MKSVISCILFIVFLTACNRKPNTLFEQVSSSKSHITFNNKVTESDSINPLDMEFLYNGGGVAVGDFNKDGKPDLYFTASQVSNKMYLNEGNFSFKDVTQKAGVTGEGRWCNAATVIDINNDGLQDIYVCATIKKNTAERENLFYINQGVDKEGIPQFKEMAKEYGLADTGFSVHAAFFDYDRDGDLDIYLVTSTLGLRNSGRFDGATEDQQVALTDKLYRNEGSDSLGHPFFKNVAKEAGITDDGFGLGVAIADVNNDGWKDIYVTNDYYSSDMLYINNGDGTFTDKAKVCFKHTSQNAMGNDVADINNDGLADIITVDMNPEDNFRKKKNMPGINYFVPINMINSGLMLQYIRNTLQLNNGLLQDTSGKALPRFSDIAFYAGVAETDWSWNPSLADFDNDGFKDLIITNGYPKDVTDHDFTSFRQNSSQSASKQSLLDQMPQIKVANYAYRNKDGLRFENVSATWGLNEPSFSSGAAYIDLDNDGDLDYVINNINEEAFVYKNNTVKNETNNYLNINFEGSALNKNGIGAIATVYANGNKQVFENAPVRGYLSAVSTTLHFGLGKATVADSVVITWPDGKGQALTNIKANQTITVNYKDGNDKSAAPVVVATPLFTNVTGESKIRYRHTEFDFVDYDNQRLLPHKLSQFGPSVAVGDVDNNGYDDLFLGASASNTGSFLLQQPNGTFIQKELLVDAQTRRPEMMGTLLFDADSDGDLDLYVASGSTEFPSVSKSLQDQFFINDGKGNFSIDTAALPNNLTSRSCAKAADFDNDGDLDLFIGGRVKAMRYPEPVSSFVYRNDSKKGKVLFTDVTAQLAPALQNIGLTCDAVWTDFDNDGWQDLLLGGEWMPLTFLKNRNGKFEKWNSGLENYKGWWTSLTAGDFDNDGDIDYVAGNTGLNSFFRANDKEPVSIYAGDLNGDGAYDAIPALYLPDEEGKRREFPANLRDDFLKQIIGKRKAYNTHVKFARADVQEILSESEREAALHLTANYLASAYIQNNGNGKFSIKPLPPLAQLAPINGMVTDDVNNDGALDLMMVGNDYGNEVVNGRYDAMNGLILLGDGKGGFQPMGLSKSGLYVPEDAKALVKLVRGNSYAIAATQNQGFLKLFSAPANGKIVRFNNDDVYAIIHLKNGQKRKEELYYGTSFLSQSARFITLNSTIEAVEIIDSKGGKRMVKP